MKRWLPGLLALAMGLGGLHAQDSALKRVIALEKERNQLLARLGRATLTQRGDLVKRVDAVVEQLELQQQLLGHGESSQTIAETSELPSPAPPAWMPPARTSIDAKLVNLPTPPRETPSTWGYRALKTKITTPPPSLPLESFVLETPVEPKVEKKGPSPEPHDRSILPHTASGILPSRELTFAVPKAYRTGDWWLWEKEKEGAWELIMKDAGDLNVSRRFQEDLRVRYCFTRRDHQPVDHPGHYDFSLDTKAPEIEGLSLIVGSFGLPMLTWACRDLHLDHLPVTLTLLNQDGVPMSTQSRLPGRGHYVIPKEIRSDVRRALLVVRDRAGHQKQKAIALD